jgi:uncharacterized protein
MTREFAPGRLDVNGFAEAAASVSGNEPLQTYQRLSAEMAALPLEVSVRWRAEGARREGPDGRPVSWLRLEVQTVAPLVCQRCLTPVEVELKVNRWFRFAADEATAAAEDDDSEEDVLVSSRDFDLYALIEDELLMEIPATPRHEHCPEPVQLSAADPDFEASEAARPNPFAVLGRLRSRKAE